MPSSPAPSSSPSAQASGADHAVLRALIVDDEPLAIERMKVLCADNPRLTLIGSALDGESALTLAEELQPDLVLLDMTMPGMDGLAVAARLAQLAKPPAVIFVTAHDHFAVDAFDLEAVDYVLKPVASDRLARAVDRVGERALQQAALKGQQSGTKPAVLPQEEAVQYTQEFWIPQRSELLRVSASEVERVDAERDYVRLHVGDSSYLLLQTIAGIEKALDPAQFIRIHRSTILRRDTIRGLKHEGLGVWSVELVNGKTLRIGRTYLRHVKAMAGR